MMTFLRTAFGWLFMIGLCAVKGISGATETSFTGTVLSNLGGASGSGKGEIRLLVDHHVYTFSYQKPLNAMYGEEGCADIGAVWQVTARGNEGDYEIVSVFCRSCSTAVHDAWLMMRSFLADLKADSPRVAYSRLDGRLQRSMTFADFTRIVRSWDLSRYSSRGKCLGVKEILGSHMVIIAEPDCQISSVRGTPLTVVFDVEAEPKSRRCNVTKICVYEFSDVPRGSDNCSQASGPVKTIRERDL